MTDTTDSYLYLITALLPLAAAMLVFQTNPYHALVIRGVLGGVSALLYAVLGAADVALTEALVGTLLAITLYAVAVRSSLVLRLGVLKDDLAAADEEPDSAQAIAFQQRLDELRAAFDPYHMRVELVPCLSHETLQDALIHKEIHATCVPQEWQTTAQPPGYQLTTRLRRIQEILETRGLTTTLLDVNSFSAGEAHP